MRFRSHMFQNVLKNNNKIIKKTQEEILEAEDGKVSNKKKKDQTGNAAVVITPLKGIAPTKA